MGNQRTTAVILIFVMLSAGCFGAVDDVAEEEKAPVVNELSLSVLFIEAQSSALLGEIVSLQISVQSQVRQCRSCRHIKTRFMTS